MRRLHWWKTLRLPSWQIGVFHQPLIDHLLVEPPLITDFKRRDFFLCNESIHSELVDL